MNDLAVNLGNRTSTICFAEPNASLTMDWQRYFQKPIGKCLIVVDEKVTHRAARLAETLGSEASMAIVPSGEGSKSSQELEKLYNRLAEMAADRTTTVIALGGGVVGDLAGFAAATWNRGLPLIMVPTTLLAMVDSAVGGKVAINHKAGKNLIGAFHQPKFVWIQLTHLDSLPPAEFQSGLAEVVKYGMILDRTFFESVEANSEGILHREPHIVQQIVRRSCEIKAKVVELDEFETTGERAKLNYGHNFAHAYEAVAGYGTISHGAAVAIGMITESRLAVRLGLIKDEIVERQRKLLGSFGLPTQPDPCWPVDDILDVLKRDKKNVAGKLRFVLPHAIGHVALHADVPEALVREVARS